MERSFSFYGGTKERTHLQQTKKRKKEPQARKEERKKERQTASTQNGARNRARAVEREEAEN